MIVQKYAPVVLTNLIVNTGGGVLAASTVPASHPNLGTSTVNPNRDVNRYWTLTASGSFGAYGGTFNYPSTDATGSASAYSIRQWNGSAWSAVTVNGTPTTTAASFSGQSGFGAFAIGDKLLSVWQYRQAITIYHTNVFNTDQTNFPVLINPASNTGLQNHAQPTGNDILFTSSDGATQIPYEREAYSSGTLVAWVKVANLSHTTDTVIYMYYGNASASDQQDTTGAVWDSNFKGVWHLQQNPTGTAPQIKDSTAGANGGTNQGGMLATDQQAAKIDGGLHFGGAANEDLAIANPSNFNFETNSLFSIEYWAKPTSNVTNKFAPISKIYNTSPYPGYEVDHNVGSGSATNFGAVRLILVNSAVSTIHQIAVYATNTKLNDGNWHHYVWTYSGTGLASGVQGYQDGVALALTTDTDSLGNNSMQSTVPVNLGSRQNAGNYYNGLLDEVRISSAVRSANWIMTEYNNQNSPATFYSVSSEQGSLDHFAVSAISSPQTAGTPFTITTITAQDVNNNTVASFGGTVTFDGTAGVTGTSGTFTLGVLNNASVTPTVAGNSLTVTVNDGSGHSGSATIATVYPAAASKLVMKTEPSSTVSAGGTFSSQPVVYVEDTYGNVVTGDRTSTVTATVQAGTGPLTGTTAATVSSGVATFSGLAAPTLAQAGLKLTFTDNSSGSPTVNDTTSITVNAGAVTQTRVETAASGSGSVVGPQIVTAGNSIMVYAITRDTYGNFVANPTATWSLQNISGGAVSGDLAGGGASAVFTGHLAGSANIQAVASSFTGQSGLQTVIATAASSVKVETKNDGTGTVVPAENVAINNSITAYAITRDPYGNFVANVAADAWSLPTKTGGVVDGDLVAASDKKSAVFTGHEPGTATIQATSGGLSATDSGTLTVIHLVQFVVGLTNGWPAQEVVVPVSVNGFTNLSSLQFSLHWDPTAADFVDVEQFGLPYLTTNWFGTTETNSGALTMLWYDLSGYGTNSVPDGTTMFAVRFLLHSSPGTTNSVTISGSPIPIEVLDSNFDSAIVETTAGQFVISTGEALAINPGFLPNGFANVSYTATLTASGGTAPYNTWSIVSGALPTGLTLDGNSGAITGTPSAAGVFNFVAGVNDSSVPVQTATQSLSITITQNIYGNGPGGPILVLANTANPFSTYYAEILLAEGLNEFALEDISSVDSGTLTNYDVVILGETVLTSDQVAMLTDWVNAGGKLIAMRPDKQLAGLLGLTDALGTITNAYLLVDTSSGPGVGIVGQTIQFHGVADQYTLNGATGLATLYSDAQTSAGNPAVTLRSVGSGQAAAFTFDLARSIVMTRQGNPAWSGELREGQGGQSGDTQAGAIRAVDLFYGAASFDPEPDWVDLNNVAIPQADEEQRLLANMVLSMHSAKSPLPRFWYFPHGYKAVVVMTGDDHAGTYGGSYATTRFDAIPGGKPPGGLGGRLDSAAMHRIYLCFS